MACSRGFLYWGRLDKRRLVLVLSSDRFNQRSDYTTVVPGSTRLHPLVTHVKLANGEGGIDRPTMLLCEHIQELPQSDLEPTPLGSALSGARMREVEAAVLLYLGIELPSLGRAGV
jgi:mRNA-degrading endonuclease toxin of MazEF toxin-antitoxin module